MQPTYMKLRNREVPLRNATKRKYTQIAKKTNDENEENDIVLVSHSSDPSDTIDLTQMEVQQEQQDFEMEQLDTTSRSSSVSLTEQEYKDMCFEYESDYEGAFLGEELEDVDMLEDELENPDIANANGGGEDNMDC
ncbi:hypothetical protein KR026_004925 [Drosophila bipectinata]|nr:hypothetical protein KR026_004925 [Drosophila bipectinata]